MKVIIRFLKNILILMFLINIQNVYAQEKVSIGLLAPFSGEYSEIGKSIIQSVRMGINKIDNDNIIIIPKDTKANPQEKKYC